MDTPVFDYSLLRKKIKSVLGTESEFAKEIGIGRVSASKRFNNKLEFTAQEMYKSAVILGFDLAEIPLYFFTIKVQKHERAQ